MHLRGSHIFYRRFKPNGRRTPQSRKEYSFVSFDRKRLYLFKSWDKKIWHLHIQAYSKVLETWHICQLYNVRFKDDLIEIKRYRTLLTNTGCEIFSELSFWLPIILINLNAFLGIFFKRIGNVFYSKLCCGCKFSIHFYTHTNKFTRSSKAHNNLSVCTLIVKLLDLNWILSLT